MLFAKYERIAALLKSNSYYRYYPSNQGQNTTLVVEMEQYDTCAWITWDNDDNSETVLVQIPGRCNEHITIDGIIDLLNKGGLT